MDWKPAAKDKLRKYDAMRTATINIPQEIARLEAEYTAIRSARSDGNPVRGGTSGREDALINNIAERQELRWALQNAAQWVKIVDRALETLSPEEKKILHGLYIYRVKGAIERLSSELGLENSTIYRRRDKALLKFTRALYGITEETNS